MSGGSNERFSQTTEHETRAVALMICAEQRSDGETTCVAPCLWCLNEARKELEALHQ